ncbi:MAG: FeoA family protein [Spirochaetales bacterium]|nr:FeoA family protein [Spirochaetales bacterium]
MKSLDLFASGESGIIEKISGGGKFLSRATAMGFTPEADISVIRNGRRGPLIVKLRDTEIAIGRGEASKIEVKEAVK